MKFILIASLIVSLIANVLLYMAFEASDDEVVAKSGQLRYSKTAEALCNEVLLSKPHVCTRRHKLCIAMKGEVL